VWHKSLDLYKARGEHETNHFIHSVGHLVLAGEAKAPWQQEWDNTLEAAKKDGKLVAGSRRIFAEEVFR